MKISCVIPAFERLDLLARCLKSALDQGDAVAEIIVTDDTPGSGVRDYLSAWNDLSGLVRYVAGPRTGNPVDNWNRGLDLAQAEVRVLAHHDEWFLDQGFFGKALERFRDREVCAVIGGVAVHTVDRPSRFALGRGLATVLGRPRALLPLLNWIGPTAAFIFRGESHRFDPALQQLVDVDFYRRILGSDPTVFPMPSEYLWYGDNPLPLPKVSDPSQTSLQLSCGGLEVPARCSGGTVNLAADRLARCG